MIAALAMALAAATSGVRAEGLERDSDDYNCSHGALESARTIEACSRLRGEPVTVEQVAVWRQQGFQRANDDYNCHHGRPHAARTIAACHRLRGDLSAP